MEKQKQSAPQQSLRNKILSDFTVGDIQDDKAILNGIQCSLQFCDGKKMVDLIREVAKREAEYRKLPRC